MEAGKNGSFVITNTGQSGLSMGATRITWAEEYDVSSNTSTVKITKLELLAGGDCGILLEDTSPAAIAAALNTVLEDKPRAAAMARNAHRNLCAAFTWDAVSQKVLALAEQR